MSFAPSPIAVRQRQLGTMLREVSAARADCRRLWRDTQRATCFENKWGVGAPNGPIQLRDARLAGARQIRAAAYRASDGTTFATFFDGTTEHIDIVTKWPRWK